MKSEYKITKEEHHFTSDEKIKWLGYGEWVEEPDTVVFEYLGYEACVQRVIKREPCKQEAYFGGHLCGYVRIPEENMYFKQKEIHVDCHYGLTFNEMHEEHWIGFDCGHSGDLIPTMELMKKQRQASGEFEPFPIPKGFENFALFHPVYRNMQYCIDECVNIIEQLANINFENNVKTAAEALDEQEPS